MLVYGLIVARAGSKGVKNKNIRQVNGRALVEYTLIAAKQSRTLNKIIISTDMQEVVQLANRYGLGGDPLRPASLATDTTTDEQLIRYYLEEHIKPTPEESGLIVYLRPTTPFKTGNIIDSAVEKMLENENAVALRSVHMVEGSENPAWQYREIDGKLVNLSKLLKIEIPSRRQDLPGIFAVNGVVDIVRYQGLKLPLNLFWDADQYLVLDKSDSIDIDTELDLEIANIMMRSKNDYRQ